MDAKAIIEIACATIEEFGAKAASVADARTAEHRSVGECDGAELWELVAASIRVLQTQGTQLSI